MFRMTALVLLVYTALFLGIYDTWKEREQEIYVRHATVLNTTYNTTIHLYQTYAETLFNEVINKEKVLEIIDEAYNAPPDRQAILRGRLYRVLYSAYNRLAKKNLRQLHFHFPDNSSFIRFHRLEKYGDSLTDSRESVRLVNSLHKPVSGFENGKIYCGFRYVFPLQHNEKHIGSVETSVSFKAIQKSMQDAAPQHYHLFIQKKDIVMEKAFPSEQAIYTTIPISPQYVVEDLRILGLDMENPVFPLAHRLNPILGKNKQLQKNIAEKQPFFISLTDQNKNYIITGLPISNIKNEQVAYIISYEENSEITTLWQTFRNIIYGLTFMVIAMEFFIWQRQKTIKQIERNEERLKAITHHMGDALYVNDAKGVITFINTAMEKQLGYASDELLGKDAHNMFHRHKRQGEMDTYKECHLLKETRAGRTFKNDADFFLRKDGTIIPVEVKGSPLQLQKNKNGSVVIFRDITERLQAEDDRLKITKLESIGVLAGGIAHDFNNLLTAIMGNIELAQMFSADNPKISKLLNEAKTASNRAVKLTNQLHTFSKGGSPITSETNLTEFLSETVAFILSGSTIHYEFLCDNDLWPVQIDTDQIQQVMSNILINAMESMESMGKADNITISCHNHQSSSQKPPQLSGKYVCIKIQDTGTGIPHQHMDKIFDPYYSTKEKGSTKGSGLGLSIVHSIIKKHEGYIEVESSEGKGTCFSIYLPATTGKSNELIKENKPTQHSASAPLRSMDNRTGQVQEPDVKTSGKILIMDDEIALLNLISTMLKQLGYTTEQAENGEQAIKLFSNARDKGQPFDAVILDLTIKNGMGGEQTMAELQTIDPAVVAIVSSGYADAPVMANYKKYGFKDCIPKPFKMKTLTTTLYKVLTQKLDLR